MALSGVAYTACVPAIEAKNSTCVTGQDEEPIIASYPAPICVQYLTTPLGSQSPVTGDTQQDAPVRLDQEGQATLPPRGRLPLRPRLRQGVPCTETKALCGNLQGGMSLCGQGQRESGSGAA
jgi:hypothetical protein